MSLTSQLVDGSQKAIQILSLIRNFGRAILKAFAEDILQIRAHGSIETSTRGMIEDLREYSVSQDQRSHHRTTLNYEPLSGSDRASNPRTEDAQQAIFGELDTLLSSSSTNPSKQDDRPQPPLQYEGEPIALEYLTIEWAPTHASAREVTFEYTDAGWHRIEATQSDTHWQTTNEEPCRPPLVELSTLIEGGHLNE